MYLKYYVPISTCRVQYEGLPLEVYKQNQTNYHILTVGVRNILYSGAAVHMETSQMKICIIRHVSTSIGAK